jgi:hypothetical protein
MRYYKFLHSVHVDNILIGGTVRISSLSYYRELERPQWIADRLEGSIEVNMTEGLVVTGDEVSSFTPEGFPLLVRADTGGKITLGNEVILNYKHRDVFVFCASQGDLAPLTEATCGDTENPYDACVRIMDMELLAHRMFHRGSILEMGGAKVGHVFSYFRCAPVEYCNLSLDQKKMTTRPPPPSPFIKHHDPFPRQREVRIAFFEPRQVLPLETLTIKIPRPKEIFVEEFRDISGAISSGSATP